MFRSLAALALGSVKEHGGGAVFCLKHFKVTGDAWVHTAAVVLCQDKLSSPSNLLGWLILIYQGLCIKAFL